jgi:O-acetyl-ADP-ribose deacetylase (regulator of RNase III)
MPADAIVNAANTALKMGGGVCGAIFKAAGASELESACNKLAPIKTGEAVITPGFKLPVKYVIHTAGPVYNGGNYGEEELLRSCYLNSLELALENGCESIVFPLISSGIYGYPKAEALRVATAAIREFLADHDLYVTLVVFDKAAFSASEKLMSEIEAFIGENYIGEHDDSRRFNHLLKVKENALIMSRDAEPGSLDEPFSQILLQLIDAKGRTDVEIYKLANINRKLFSKIRSNKDYMPSKRTVIAFAVALKLTLSETDDLLERVGYALSRSQKSDVIIEYFIARGIYDIFKINEVLFSYDLPLLGG